MIHINPLACFIRSYKKVSLPVQKDFDKKVTLFMVNPKDPKLKTHRLHGKLQSCLAFRLRDGYRVLFEYADKDTVNLETVQ